MPTSGTSHQDFDCCCVDFECFRQLLRAHSREKSQSRKVVTPKLTPTRIPQKQLCLEGHRTHYILKYERLFFCVKPYHARSHRLRLSFAILLLCKTSDSLLPPPLRSSYTCLVQSSHTSVMQILNCTYLSSTLCHPDSSSHHPINSLRQNYAQHGMAASLSVSSSCSHISTSICRKAIFALNSFSRPSSEIVSCMPLTLTVDLASDLSLPLPLESAISALDDAAFSQRQHILRELLLQVEATELHF